MDSCYPFLKVKERQCVCEDIVNDQMCGEDLMTNYVCPGTKPCKCKNNLINYSNDLIATLMTELMVVGALTKAAAIVGLW